MYYNKIYNPITGKQVNLKSKLGKKILKKYVSLGGFGGASGMEDPVASRSAERMVKKKLLNHILNIPKKEAFALTFDYKIDSHEEAVIDYFESERIVINRDIPKFINIFKPNDGQQFYIIGEKNHGNDFQTILNNFIELGLLNKGDLNGVTLFCEQIQAPITDINNAAFKRYSLDDNTYTIGKDFGLTKDQFYKMRCFYSNPYWSKYIKENKGPGINIIAVGASHIHDVFEKNFDETELFSLPLQIHMNNFLQIEPTVFQLYDYEEFPEHVWITQNKINKQIPNLLDLSGTSIFQFLV